MYYNNIIKANKRKYVSPKTNVIQKRKIKVKKVILFILMISPLFSSTNYNLIRHSKTYIKTINNIEHLDYRQRESLLYLYEKCYEYDLANTCVAIGYKESRLGKYMFNDVTGDYGLLGINLKTFMNTNNIKRSYWKEREVATRLITDNDFNVNASIANLMFWKKQYKNNWLKIWASYNGGYNPNYTYAKDILLYIKAFKELIRNDEELRYEVLKIEKTYTPKR